MDEKPLRYVVLRHEGVEEPHFDLMFETSPASALSTWRSPEWPLKVGTKVTRLPDHRPWYLTYEGEISGARGWVRRVASGTHRLLEHTELIMATELEDGTVLRLYRGNPGVALVLPPSA